MPDTLQAKYKNPMPPPRSLRRRDNCRLHIVLLCGLLAFALAVQLGGQPCMAADKRPNILFAISDDQSYPHASAYGYKAIDTPAFGRVARQGVLFHNAFTASPGCSPSRAAILTGRYPWQLEHAGTHASAFPAKYVSYVDLLEQGGYFVGYCGKGWGPGNWKISGRDRNPAGPAFKGAKHESPPGISSEDYAANFQRFLAEKPADKPFHFWYGASEPHRGFGDGVGTEHGGDPAAVKVPEFLPDTPLVRSDMLDYLFEIEWFDQQLGKMLALLEEAGELENTIIIVTSDNGMAFPRAKANCYEYGIHMPLAVSWPERFPAGREVNDLVSLTDIAPTLLEIAGVEHPSEKTGEYPMAGRSLSKVLAAEKSGQVDPERTAVYSHRERHSSSRWNNLAYPQRCIRTQQYLYIRNFRPERWPAGAPQKFGRGSYADPGETELGPMHGGYHDIDACPALTLLVRGAGDPELSRYLHLAVAHRPAEELFDIQEDPACLHNLAGEKDFAPVREELAARLENYLRETGDPRVVDGGDVFETYKRYSRLRYFPKPDWATERAADGPNKKDTKE